MCDACTKLLDRRSILRGAIIGGTAIASGTLWLPDGVSAGDDTIENAAMAEDSLVFAAIPSSGSSSGTVQVPSAGSSAGTNAGTAKVLGVRTIPAPNFNSVAPPPIVTRQQWRADETIRSNERAYAPVRKLIVHHTASENKPSSPVSVVRFVQKYHTTGRGFSDTGYNYLIDHKGVIYEGRAARQYTAKEAVSEEDNRAWGVVGAHAKGVNAGSCGICMIGDFELASPTDAAVASLVWLLAWKASYHRIDPLASEEYIDIYGGRRAFPNIAGHRQVGSTQCPGRRLYKLLPAIRDEVARRAGHWDPMTVDIPFVLRRESGQLRNADPSVLLSGAGSTGSAGSPGSGTKLVGFRVVSDVGTVYTAGKGTKHGSPSSGGAKAVVAIANTMRGDGYWVLGADGTVYPFGGVASAGDAAGKGTAVDITVTGTGQGYWILMADGGIYPFGDAGYASSPRRAGLGGAAVRMAARPQADGYWVLMADSTIRAFGRAPQLGAPANSGTVVDLWPTPSGKGYWALTDTGIVVPFGDAPDKGDVKRSGHKWSRKGPRHIVGTPSGNGYVIVNAEGSMLAFGDAPLFASFAGSGMNAVGAAPAFG
jgi:N-acetylmuramoyl-L-alanine amidase